MFIQQIVLGDWINDGKKRDGSGGLGVHSKLCYGDWIKCGKGREKIGGIEF